MKSQLSAFNAKAGIYTLKEDDDMKAKLAGDKKIGGAGAEKNT